MKDFTIQEHDGLWSVRENDGTFPIFEGRPAVVREYLRRRCQWEGRGAEVLEVRVEGGCGHVRLMNLAEMR
jgi:hypothetical protein